MTHGQGIVSLQKEFPDWWVLTNIDAAIAPDDAACERWVSCLNRIKSKDRSRLNADTLDDLMMISLNGPAPEKVDWLQVLELWRLATTRGRYKGGKWQSDAIRLANELQTGGGLD